MFLPPDGDACKSIPCANNGRCKDGIGTYTCFCPTGYRGFNCEIGKETEKVNNGLFLLTITVSFCSSTVIPQLCENENGGCEHFCHVVRGNIQCSCADGYFLASDDKSCHSSGEKSRDRTTVPTEITKPFKRDVNSCRKIQVRWNRPGKYQNGFPVWQAKHHHRQAKHHQSHQLHWVVFQSVQQQPKRGDHHQQNGRDAPCCQRRGLSTWRMSMAGNNLP